MAMLKSYESRNPNDMTGLLSEMANFLHAFFVAKPVHELAKHMWTLKRQLLHFPYNVNEHSKAIEAIAILFVHSMEPVVEREEKEEKRAKRSIGRRGKQWDFIPSQSQSHSHNVQSSLRTNELSSDFERPPSSSTRPLSSLSQPPFNQSGNEETWEESTMDMDEFNLNRPRREETEEERTWEDDGDEMPLLEEEEGERRYSGGLRGRGTQGVRREEGKTDDDREERRYGGGLRGGRTAPTTPSTTVSLTSPLKKMVPTPQRRIIVNRERPMKVAIIRRSIPTSSGKITLKKVGTLIRREGSTIGMGKPNIAHENHLLLKICPKSARLECGVDMEGSSFIARSRARTSGMMQEIEGNGGRNESDVHNREKGGHSLEETMIESRKEEMKKELHDGRRYTTNAVEATFNSNLSETWWATESRNSGATLLSYRLNRTTQRKDDEPILRGRINRCEKDE